MSDVAMVGSWKMWVVKMDSRGRITLPEPVRERLGIKVGDVLSMTEGERGLKIKAAGWPHRSRGGEAPTAD